MPVYFISESPRIFSAWPAIVAGITGVVIGTISGERLLRRIPEQFFRRVVSAIVLAIGHIFSPPRYRDADPGDSKTYTRASCATWAPGNRKLNRAPRPACDSTHISPPCSSTVCRESASPSPSPFLFPAVTNG